MAVAANVRARARGPVLGLAGQLLNAATNVVTAFVASYLLDPGSFGMFVLAYACVTIVLATGRGLICSTLLSHLPGLDADTRTTLTGSVLGFTLCAGLGVTAVLGAVALFVPTLAWFVPWVLVALYQDVGRHVYLAQGRNGSALMLDVAWALAQIAVFAAWLLAGASITLGVVACAWGVGALAGAVLFAVRSGARPTHPARWVRTTRDVAGWFTGTAIHGQCEVYLVLLLTGWMLMPSDAGGLRAVQLVTLQPAIVLLASVLVLATPVFARLPADAGSAALNRASTRVLVAVLPVIALVMLLVPLRIPLMSLVLPQYLGFESLVLPTALQVVTYALSVPALALLRGRRHGAQVFWLQILRTGLVLASALVGLAGAGVDGVAWALVVASSLTLVVMLTAAHRARSAFSSAVPG
jgi:O-antigen/teichoic acid export membrane protein